MINTETVRQRGFVPILIIIIVSFLAATGATVVAVSKGVDLPTIASEVVSNVVSSITSQVSTISQNQAFVPAPLPTENTHTLITPSPSPIATPIPVPLPTMYVPVVKCLGADGLYSSVTQEDCDSVKKFWDAHPPAPATGGGDPLPEAPTPQPATPTPTPEPTVTPTPTPTPTPQSSGPLSPGTLINDASSGNNAWANPSNAQSSNDIYASSGSTQTGSNYLKATNFGFSIPNGATVNGIIVEIEKRYAVAGAYYLDHAVKIVKSDGTYGTANKASVTQWPVTDTYSTYGSSSDLWDETWAASDINDADFGVGISQKETGRIPSTAYIDHLRITVYYTY